jgi:sugar lactone lactonase YvrE
MKHTWKYLVLSGLVLLAACRSIPPIPDAEDGLRLLWDQGTFTEGPTIDREGAVLFTDLRRNLIRRYDPRSGETTIYRENSGSANGLAFDRAGKLLACEGADGGRRRISITDRDGQVKTLVDHYQGQKFNSPNDIAVAPNGDIYFTDPRYRGPESVDLDFEGVFLVRGNQAILASRDTERPNGILVSADGRSVFVADNNNREGGARTLLKFAIAADGSLENKEVLHRFRNDQRGIDGMAMDAAGRIYAAAGKGEDAGIYIFTQEGHLRDRITVPDLPTNCTFGGPDHPDTLYITAQVKTETDGTPRFGLFCIRLGSGGSKASVR